MKEERKRILKMVEQGTLTVDEALTLIEELDKTSKVNEEKARTTHNRAFYFCEI